MNVKKVSQVVINNVVVSEQKGNKSKIMYKEDEELFQLKIQTGKMKIQWDPKERQNPSGKVISVNLSASTFEMFDTENKNNVRLFKELVYNLERLHKPFTEDLKLSTSMYQNDPKWSPVAQMSIPIKDGHPDVSVFNKGGGQIDFSDVKKGSVCEFIIRVSHFWESAKSYGLQLVVEQIKVINDVKVNRFLPVDSDSDSD
jgi:hypothetical protein